MTSSNNLITNKRDEEKTNKHTNIQIKQKPSLYRLSRILQNSLVGPPTTTSFTNNSHSNEEFFRETKQNNQQQNLCKVAVEVVEFPILSHAISHDARASSRHCFDVWRRVCVDAFAERRGKQKQKKQKKKQRHANDATSARNTQTRTRQSAISSSTHTRTHQSQSLYLRRDFWLCTRW